MHESAATTHLTRQVRRILAPNPGPMTLSGTNTYVVRARPGAPAVVIDPGPDMPDHVERICAGGPVALILVTHEHADHTAAVPVLHARTGAPVRGFSPEWSLGADVLRDRERIDVADVSLVAHHTPGHTRDSVCFEVLDDATLEAPDARVSSVCTGDTVLGEGSTLVQYPEGPLAGYLDSLQRLRTLGSGPMLPGHGPVHTDLQAAVDAALAHRRRRLAQLTELLSRDEVWPDPDDAALVDHIREALYAQVPAGVIPAARSTIRAQLEFLRGQTV